MKESKQIAVFKGHKVRNDHKVILRFYENPLQPWTLLVYDEVFKTLTTVPREELYDFVVTIVFNKRKLWTTGRELENVFGRIPIRKRHTLKEPRAIDTVCFLKNEYVADYENQELDFLQVSTLSPDVALSIDWTKPHCCLNITDNVTDETRSLIITLPEVNSVVLANPKYFDVKEKTR